MGPCIPPSLTPAVLGQKLVNFVCEESWEPVRAVALGAALKLFNFSRDTRVKRAREREDRQFSAPTCCAA